MFAKLQVQKPIAFDAEIGQRSLSSAKKIPDRIRQKSAVGRNESSKNQGSYLQNCKCLVVLSITYVVLGVLENCNFLGTAKYCRNALKLEFGQYFIVKRSGTVSDW
jgi:uncharacterized membrane protein YiaA